MEREIHHRRRARRPGTGAVPDQEKPLEPRPGGSPARRTPPPPLAWPLWRRVWRKFNDDDVLNQAAKVAYWFFMSLPSLLLAVFSLAGLVGDQANAEWLSATLQANLPPDAAALIRGFVADVVRKAHPAPLSIGLLLALWFGAAVFIALEDTLNTAYGVACTRGFVRRVGVALACMVGVGALLTVGSLALLAGPEIAKGLGMGAAWTVASWVLAYGMIVAALWTIYYVLPSRDQRARKRTLLQAAAFASLLFVLASFGMRLYATTVGYGKTYGALGGIIVLLLWMYYTSLAILLGGEVAAELERGRRRG